jgi:GT2 family glycosyltransferase
VISVVIISKDEPSLDGTLRAVTVQAAAMAEPCEIVVVDASEGRLDFLRREHERNVRWVTFHRPPGISVSIPHQRNAGVRSAAGEIIVFTDSGCAPAEGWLERLTAPLRHGERVTAGLTLAAAGGSDPYHDSRALRSATRRYLDACSTINMAFHREVFDAVGGFDETFAYGSDVDFSWRLVDAGYRILAVPDAVTRHDWGTWRRQLGRSFAYGRARARLYGKHRSRRSRVLRDDPMVIVYPAFLLGLPLTLVFPLYPALLLIPVWRNRSHRPVQVVVEHLTFGTGVLTELALR